MRSQAAARLGRSSQEIRDLKLAQKTPSRFLRNIREDLAEVLVENGSFMEAVESLRSVRSDYHNHGQGFLFRSLSSDAALLARAGLLNAAKQASDKALEVHTRIIDVRAYENFENLWECYHFQMLGLLNRQRGIIKRSIRYFGRALNYCRKLYETGYDASQGGAIREAAGSFRLERKYRRVVDFYVDLLVRAGRLVEAESVIRTAIKGSLASTGPNSILTTNHLLSLSNVLLAQGRLKDAETIAGKIIGFHMAAGFSDKNTSKLKAHLVKARAFSGQGLWREAGAEFSFIQDAIGDQPSILTSSLKTSPAFGLALSYSGEHAEAEKLLSGLVKFNRETLGEKSITTALSRGALGVVLNRSGKGVEALPLLEAVLPVISEHSRRSAMESTRDAEFNQWKQIIYEAYLDQLAKGFVKVKDPAISVKAFEVAQLSAGGSVQKAFAASSTRAAAGNKELSGLVRKYQDLVQRSKNLNGLLLSRINQAGGEGSEAALEKLREQISDIKTAQLSLADEIEDRFPEYSNLMNPKPVSLKTVRTSLKSDEALIVTHVGDEKSYVWAIPKSGEVAFSASELGRKKLQKDVGSLRRSLNPLVETLDDIPAFNVRLAGKVYRELLEPVSEGWKSAKNLLVIPDGPLGQLPLSVLVTKQSELEARPETYFAGYKKVPFLVKSHSVAVVPSVSSLIALRNLPSNRRERKSFVGIGDPFFSKQQAAEADKERKKVQIADNRVTVRGLPIRLRAAPKLSGVSTADLALLPRLPDTADEVVGIARVSKADPEKDVFLGRDASEGKVKKLDLAKYRIIVFATHGLVAGDLDGLTEPALALTSPAVTGEEGDGLLALGEILALKLDADWVVLSACNTAGADGETSEAMSGLARAFFYAGARALLVSNWPVETISAKKLTTDIFRRQADQPGLSRAQALRRSMVQLINGPGFTDKNGKTLFSYAHPIFWAPFALVGDGGASVD
jgi:CHAT domain-containing protein